MKTMQKVLSVLLAVLLLASAVPTAFAADDAIIASGGINGTTWTLTENGVLTVSGNGPIEDVVETEVDPEDGSVSYSTVDCIAWQLSDVFDARTQGLDAGEAERVRFNLVKTLIIEEGITAIPDDEFSDYCPRVISLPASLQEAGSVCINAAFAESLTVKNKDLVLTGSIHVLGYEKGAQPYASLDEAIEAKIASEQATEALSQKLSVLYDLQNVYGMLAGVNTDQTKAEFLAYFNEAYGTSFTKLIQCRNYCLKRVNKLFSTNYSSADELFNITGEDDFRFVETNEQIDQQVNAMYAAATNEARLMPMQFGAEYHDDATAYPWLTIYAPSGSSVEEAAKATGVTFQPTTPPQKVTLLDKIRQFFADIRARIEMILTLLRMRLQQQ